MALPPNISKRLNYFGIHFNEEAVVVLTGKHVPGYVRFVASLGKSFNYCKPVGCSSAIDMLVCMRKILARCDHFEQYFNMDSIYKNVKRELINGSAQHEKPSRAQEYIHHLFLLSENYLNKHRKLIIVPSDKGGKTVVMDRDDYFKKANSYIDENILLGNYVEEYRDYESVIAPEVESAFAHIVGLINPYLLKEKSIKEPLRLESYSIPLFYGCPKIHKDGFPLRPIIAAVNMIGDFISSWILEKLNLIADYLGRYKVNNSYSLMPDLKNFQVEHGHVLSSYDYVSMYTNIDVEETILLISQYYSIIQHTTTVPPCVFMQCLRFFINDATFFMFNGRIFKQCKGLAMGNRLAQALAEIRTDHALLQSLQCFNAELISFIYKYVDDIFSASDEGQIMNILNKISDDVGMELTVTTEDDAQEVDFLDCTIKRNDGGTLSTKWLKKKFSSLSTLNFHSFHPWSMKKNVVFEMAKRAFFLTSPEFEQSIRGILSKILVNSSYPELFILETTHFNPWNVSPQHRSVNLNLGYIGCPYVEPLFSRINTAIKNNRMRCKLAPTPSANNRRMLFSRLKDSRGNKMLKNSVFKVMCQNCPFDKTLSTVGNLNINQSLIRHVNNSSSLVRQHLLQNPHHALDENFKVIKTFHSGWDTRQSEWIFGEMESLNNSA